VSLTGGMLRRMSGGMVVQYRPGRQHAPSGRVTRRNLRQITYRRLNIDLAKARKEGGVSPHAEERGCKPRVSKHEGGHAEFAAILRDAMLRMAPQDEVGVWCGPSHDEIGVYPRALLK
jgi:hypothetical protein